jgi:hypothetical protein
MMGFPRGGILTYHRLAIRNANMATTINKAGTPKAKG